MEVTVCTGSVLTDTSEVVVALEQGNTTCEDLLREVLQACQLSPSSRGAWQLEEDWNGCRRTLGWDELVPVEGIVTLHLEHRGHSWEFGVPARMKRKKLSSLELGRQFTCAPLVFLSHPRILSRRRLQCVEACLCRRLEGSQRKYSATLLQRLAGRQLLWGPPAPSPLDRLFTQLNQLQQENLQLSTELADRNIESTRLQGQVGVVSKRAGQLSGELAFLQEEVKRRKQERAKVAPKNVEQMRADLAKLVKELDMKNQVNNGLNSKLQKVKDHLKTQRKVLEERKKEIEKLKGWGGQSHDRNQQTTKKSASTKSAFVFPPTKSTTADMTVSALMPLKRGTPSSSRKRHAHIIEVKSRQLVEEEGHAFRQQQTKQQQGGGKGAWSGDVGGSPVLLPHTDVPSVPIPDAKCYEGGGVASGAAGSGGGGAGKGKGRRRVRFDAEATILNAALEGELDLLKQCIQKLGGCDYSNDKGATCLHNAVCSGNFEAVSYLVDHFSNINAQDIDGWTPLHCAVAYSNVEMVRYLVEHGASMFLATRDGDMPLNIAQEEHKLLLEEEKGAESQENHTLQAAEECLHYLTEMESGLGRVNGCVVFALFSRVAEEEGELELREGEKLLVTGHGLGEKWWTVRNGKGEEGQVPSTFLGPYKQTTEDTL